MARQRNASYPIAPSTQSERARARSEYEAKRRAQAEKREIAALRSRGIYKEALHDPNGYEQIGWAYIEGDQVTRVDLDPGVPQWLAAQALGVLIHRVSPPYRLSSQIREQLKAKNPTPADFQRPSDSEIAVAGHVLQECHGFMSDRDYDFARSLVAAWHRGRLSDKQAYWLVQLFNRIERSNRRAVKDCVDMALAYVAAGNYNESRRTNPERSTSMLRLRAKRLAEGG